MKRLRNLVIVIEGDRQASAEYIKHLIRGMRTRLNGILAQMRMERARRWKDSLPRVWAHSPARVFDWLRGEQASWGSVPLVSDDGNQLVSIAEVDSAAKEFWVRGLWRRDDPAHAEDHWRDFSASEFSRFIPRCSWPEVVWTPEMVKDIISSMKQSAPGTWGIPVSVWKTLPSLCYASVAKLFQQIHETGEWPENLLDAYVVLIPKGQGNEMKSQRPITVLQILFRIFAKGIVRTWRETLMGTYLGEQAMGFRTGTGRGIWPNFSLMLLPQGTPRERKFGWLSSIFLNVTIPSPGGPFGGLCPNPASHAGRSVPLRTSMRNCGDILGLGTSTAHLGPPITG